MIVMRLRREKRVCQRTNRELSLQTKASNTCYSPQISMIFRFFKLSNTIIFFIILLSDRKFWPKDFLSFSIFFEKQHHFSRTSHGTEKNSKKVRKQNFRVQIGARWTKKFSDRYLTWTPRSKSAKLKQKFENQKELLKYKTKLFETKS